MKKVLLFLIAVFLLASCSVVEADQGDPSLKYTEAVKTVSVQLTNQALLTPSATVTSTPEPTATMTSTPEPSPTVPTPTPTWSFNDAGSVKSPILLYYHIADDLSDNPSYDAGNDYNVSSANFTEQMVYLSDNGFTSVPVSLLVQAILEGANVPQKPVAITFDGGTAGIYTKAFPIMQQLGFTGTLFITINYLDQPGYLTSAQVKEMLTAGWEIGSRGYNGYDLTSDYSVLSDEISGSRLKLEELFGVSVKIFAYPYGRTDDVILQRISPWGYSAAVGTTWYEVIEHTSQNLFYLARFEVKSSWTLDNFGAVVH